MGERDVWPPPAGLAAVVCDLNGVVTDTAAVHRRAWAETFDGFLARRAAAGLVPAQAAAPFSDGDYAAYVDGRPRLDGVRTFLASRGVELPVGTPADPPGDDTAWAVGNAKDERFVARLADGVTVFPDAVAFVREARAHGWGAAVVSSSAHCRQVLGQAGLGDLFSVRVDAQLAAELGLPGKPDPATFVEAARRLGAAPPAAVLVEDAAVGVEAGRRGAFGLVAGVDRAGGDPRHLGRWADVVVPDLDALRRRLFGSGRGDVRP